MATRTEHRDALAELATAALIVLVDIERDDFTLGDLRSCVAGRQRARLGLALRAAREHLSAVECAQMLADAGIDTSRVG